MFCSIKNSLPFKLVSFFIFFCTLILNPKKKAEWKFPLERANWRREKPMEIELAQRKANGNRTRANWRSGSALGP